MLLQLGYQAVIEGQGRSVVDHVLRLHARRLESDHLFQVNHVFFYLLGLFELLVRPLFKRNELFYKLSVLFGQQLVHMLGLLLYKVACFLE